MGREIGPELKGYRRPPIQWWRAVRLGAGIALGAVLAVTVPKYLATIPPLWLQYRIARWSPFFLVLCAIAFLSRRPKRLLGLPLAPSVWEKLDTYSRRALESLLGPALMLFCAVLLLIWAPPYCTWPWWPDTEQFAISAQSWDAGLLPYRDLPDFDFPGPIYLCWALGKAFGWGHTALFYLADVALLVFLGWALAAWSRRKFLFVVPGLVAYAAFLRYYLDLDYSRVAQRDWEAPCFAVLAILALEAWPGWKGRGASALALAVAATFRPQVVLFLPATVLAVDESARASGERWAPTVRALCEWSAMFACALLLVFSPLLLAGVADDFVRSLGVSHYGGSYNRASLASVRQSLVGQFGGWRLSWTVVASVVAAIASPLPLRRTARTWCLALLAVLVYKPMSPVPHDYLNHPRTLVRCVELAVLLAWIYEAGRMAWSAKLLATLALAAAVFDAMPAFWTPSETLSALRPLLRGEEPPYRPLGVEVRFGTGTTLNGRYGWNDYRNVLTYLRTKTGRETLVANFIRNTPFPALNGPTGRLSPFPAAGGLLWIWWIKADDEPAFAKSLAQATDAVVVWVPGERAMGPSLRLKRVERVIRHLYKPEARFGLIEVWRRMPGARMPGDRDVENPGEGSRDAPETNQTRAR
jgi:hypothetical protein